MTATDDLLAEAAHHEHAGGMDSDLIRRLAAEVERLQAIIAPLRDVDIPGVRRIVNTRQGAGIWRDEQVDALDRLHERWMEHVARLVARAVSPTPPEGP